jgi:hypothetical protein
MTKIDMRIGKKAEALILNYEGWDLAWVWPGSSSGITIPFGYDLGYEPFARDWAGLLDPKDFQRLSAVVGLKGQKAAAVAHSLRGIHIPHAAATSIFERITVPRYEEETLHIYPNAIKGPADCFGALVSLVFNRGDDLRDRPGRKPRGEMRSIAQTLAQRDPAAKTTWMRVADLIEAQARYWPNNLRSDSDLHDRRVDEAALVRSCW